MKFISSLELIESPVEKLALKGLPNEITLLRSNLRTSVISGNRKIMNDVRDAEGEIQCNGQIKDAPGVSNQVKNSLTLNSCGLIVKKVIVPPEWEKKLAESSSLDSNGLSESKKMAPGFTTHKVNKVYLESKESDTSREDSSMDIELLKSKTLPEISTSVPEQSAAETSNGQLDEWSNEASNSAGEESLSNNHSPHTLATNVTNDCSAKMPLETENCSPNNVEKCDSQENELKDEVEHSENLNLDFAKEQLDTELIDKTNGIRHRDDQVSELDMVKSGEENTLLNITNVTTDTRENLDVESKEESGNSPKSYNPSMVEQNEFEERTKTFSFYDKLAASTIHNNTDDFQTGNDFSSISSEGSNSRLADIVEDLENMDSLHASNVEFDNTSEAVDQSDNLDELNSEYQLEPDDDNGGEDPDDDIDDDDDMSGLNDFVEANTENSSEIDIHDNVEDLENIEGNDIDAAMDVDVETENLNIDIEIHKTKEHGDVKVDELMDTEESAYKTGKVVDAEGVVNEVTELLDSEKVLTKGSVERDVDKSYSLLHESALGESSEPASAEEMLGRINDLQESETHELKDVVPPDTSNESFSAEETNEISKPEGYEKVVGETCEILNKVPLGMAAESGECDVSVNESNELLGVASLGTTDESSKAEETFDKESELSKQIGLIKADGELAEKAALDNTNELCKAEAILDRTDELSNITTELASVLSNKSPEAAIEEETLDETFKVVDEPVLDKTGKLNNVEAILDKPDELMEEVALDKTDDAEVMLDKANKSTLDTTDKLDDAEATEVTCDSMDTEEMLDEGPKHAVVETALEDAIVVKTPEEDAKCSAVSEGNVDTKEKISDGDSDVLPDAAAPEKCLESKQEKDADVTADKLGVKRLASEDEAVTEVKRTKIQKEEGTLVTEDINSSEAEAKEFNGEVFRTAGKRLSEPVEGGEAKKPRLHLESEISDDGAVDINKIHDSHHTQPEDKIKVDLESERKEEVSDSDKVANSTKEEEESLHLDSKTSEAAPAEKVASEVSAEAEPAEKNSLKVSAETESAEKNSSKVSSETEPAEKNSLKVSAETEPAETDASESTKESDKPNEAAVPKNDAEPPKPPPPPKQMSNLDLAIERVVAAAAAEAEAEEAARTAPIDIDDDDDDEVVETVPTKSSDPKKLYSLPFMDKLHSNVVKKMGRNELEEFVMQKVCEVLTERCQLGRLRQQVQALEEQNESWRKKTQMLQKQLKDLDLVMKRFVNDARMKRDRPFPVKVTRSVGLQVHMSGTGPLQAGKQRSPGDTNTRNQPAHRRRNRASQNASQSMQNQSQPATTTAASSTATSTTTVQQPQPPQPQTSPVQQQPALAQMATTAPTQPMKMVQPNARSPICNSVTVQKVVAPNLAKVGTTATIVSPRTSTSNMVNTPVKLPATTKQPVPIRPAITTVPMQNTITTVNSTARSLSPGLRVASASQLNSRTIRPGVTATLCPVSKPSDSKVIDLTDEDDKSKLNVVRFTTNSTAAPVNTTVVSTATTGVHSGAIRVVHPHQLTGNATTTILAAGNQQPQSRFAYLMPTTVSPGQQRQVLIATSAPQVRPGMVTMSNRPNMSPATFLLKNGSMLPLQQPNQAQTVPNATAILRPATNIQQPGGLQTVRAGQPVRVSPSLVGRLPTANMPITPALNKQHPAPLPAQPMCQPSNPLWKCAPPKPDLKTSRVNNNKQQGIVLSWNMQLTPEFEEIASYQLFAYQEGPAPPNTNLWKKVGDVKALPLPMACTLTQFMEGHKYHFAVRAVDVHSRVGPFSVPRNIVLTRK